MMLSLGWFIGTSTPNFVFWSRQWKRGPMDFRQMFPRFSLVSTHPVKYDSCGDHIFVARWLKMNMKQPTKSCTFDDLWLFCWRKLRLIKKQPWSWSALTLPLPHHALAFSPSVMRDACVFAPSEMLMWSSCWANGWLKTKSDQSSGCTGNPYMFDPCLSHVWPTANCEVDSSWGRHKEFNCLLAGIRDVSKTFLRGVVKDAFNVTNATRLREVQCICPDLPCCRRGI